MLIIVTIYVLKSKDELGQFQSLHPEKSFIEI